MWRALPPSALSQALEPAPSAEGRFHHSGQRALYLSPSAQSANRATARNDATPRIAVTLHLSASRIVDLRRSSTLQALGLEGFEATRPWRPERLVGRPATSWRASDAARAIGADGLIWTARNAPHLWHLVLFCWNTAPEGAWLTLPPQNLP